MKEILKRLGEKSREAFEKADEINALSCLIDEDNTDVLVTDVFPCKHPETVFAWLKKWLSYSMYLPRQKGATPLPVLLGRISELQGGLGPELQGWLAKRAGQKGFKNPNSAREIWFSAAHSDLTTNEELFNLLPAITEGDRRQWYVSKLLAMTNERNGLFFRYLLKNKELGEQTKSKLLKKPTLYLDRETRRLLISEGYLSKQVVRENILMYAPERECKQIWDWLSENRDTLLADTLLDTLRWWKSEFGSLGNTNIEISTEISRELLQSPDRNIRLEVQGLLAEAGPGQKHRKLGESLREIRERRSGKNR